MKFKKILALLLAVCIITSVAVAGASSVNAAGKEIDFDNSNDLLLWYTASARNMDPANTDENDIWQNYTLPIGNGFIGATIYGEVGREEILLNEKTLWNGGPSESRPDYDGGNIDKTDVYSRIVEAFRNGDSETASALCEQLVGEGSSGGYGEYQPFGNLYIDFGFDEDLAENYIRTLDMNTAVSTVEFDCGGTHYKREYFVSYPDNVMVVRLTSDSSNSITCTATLPSLQGGESAVSGNVITTSGQLADNQMKYNGQLLVDNDGGTLSSDGAGGSITVTGANEVVMYLSLATDYLNDYPTYRTGETDAEVNAKVARTVENASAKGYSGVLASHLSDYQELFGRVQLDLGQEAADIPTNELLTKYNSNALSSALKSELEVMLFQYGRYLTIASSRDGSLPSNLQGIWQNRTTNVAWASDYHMNVNLQMNYWPTYSTNLAECATPLIDYVESLREPGRVTAANYFGIVSEEGEANGFTAHTQNTPFGWTCPGWSFSWGWSPAAVPWILQNCWEYYEYTGDVEYMAENIYPMMLEECKLYTQILVWDEENGRYVTAPSYSPEHGPYTFGNTYESSLVWQMFTDTITAAEILGTDTGEDKELIDTIKDMVTKLNPIEIGDSGQIKEWFGDEEGEIGKTADGSAISGYDSSHRHLSHMLGLFPGDLIQTNDEWIEAARVSMENRPDQTTGWGMGQRINTWARLGDGDKAYELIEYLFGSGIYSNLWDAHPPFQIDGNFGMTSGVSEMLLQSNMGYINILPALPSEWSSGSYSGLVARGNFEISVDWKYGKAYQIEIISNNGGECTVKYDSIDSSTITDSSGAPVSYTSSEAGYVTFDTAAGETYTVTNLEEGVPSAPENVTATLKKGNKIAVEWSTLEGETYTLYKKTGDGEYEIIAEGLTEGYYLDKYAADTDTDTISYKVKAVFNLTEGPCSQEVIPAPPSEIVAIDKSDMTATACSQYSNSIAEGVDGAAGSVLDGNINTWWHSNWASDIPSSLTDSDHHWLKVEFAEAHNLAKIVFTPRQNSQNGRPTVYNLYIINEDGSETLAIENGTMENSTAAKTITLDEPALAYGIKIKYVEAIGDSVGIHGTCAELDFYEKVQIEEFENGDVDDNGEVNAVDATLVLQYYADIITSDDLNTDVADLNGDGEIDSKDATLILQKYAGIIDKFPIE